MWVGTLNNITFRGLSPRVESAIGADPFNAPRGVNFQNVPDRNGNEGVRPAPAQPPRSPIPPATAPSDLFRTPAPPAGVPTPAPTPDPRIGTGIPPVPESSLNPPNQEKPVQVASSDEGYRLKFSPRIAPQPSRLAFKPGEERIWSVVGMDLSGLTVPQLVLRYDPMALDIAGASVGTAFLVDPQTPPMVKIDPAMGTIRVMSTDGNPLRFQNGGEVLSLRVRGGLSGDTMLVMDPPVFSSAGGERVDVAVAGGAARVE